MPLAQVVEDLAHVEVLLHRGPEQLQAGVARELLDLVAGRKEGRKKMDWLKTRRKCKRCRGILSKNQGVIYATKGKDTKENSTKRKGAPWHKG